MKSGKTRWLSRSTCVRVLLELFIPLTQLLHRLSSSDEVAAALHDSMCTYMFVGVLAGMVDILSLLATLSQSFRRNSIDFTTIQTRLHQIKSALVQEFLSRKAELGDKFNPNLSKDDWDDLWDKVLADGVQSVFDEPSSTHVSEFLSGDDNVFRGVALAAVDREELCTWLTKFALAVMSRLCERFAEDDMKVLQALEIFNPLRAPLDPAQLETYGDTEIDMLCSHYGKPKQVDSKVFPAMADPDQLKVEWRLLKHTLSKARAEASDSTAASDLIASLLDDDAAMENTTILMQIRQVLVWTVDYCHVREGILSDEAN